MPDSAQLAAARRFRTWRFGTTLLTSILSKTSTAGVQLVAMPVALAAMGHDKYAAYAAIASATAWLSVGNLGLGPNIVVRVSAARARGDQREERRVVASSFFPVAILAVVCLLLALPAVGSLPAEWLVGRRGAEVLSEVLGACAVLVVCTVLQAVCSVFEAAQAGVQEQYRLNTLCAFGNLVACGAVLAAASQIAAKPPQALKIGRDLMREPREELVARIKAKSPR